MCVAYPGKVESTDGMTAVIDYGGSKVTARTGGLEVRPGQWALVHAGFIIQTVPEDEAKEMNELFSEIEELKG